MHANNRSRSKCNALLRSLFVGLIGCIVFGSGEANANCGSSSYQMVWRLGSAAELIRWNGNLATETFVGPEVSMSRHDPDQKVCTECRCRRENEGRPLPNTDRIETPRYSMVSIGLHSYLDFGYPPVGDVLVCDSFSASRGLEVLKRPPRISV